jgi:hypothetical protein
MEIFANDHEFLKRSKLFGSLSDEEREELYKIAIKKSYSAESEIYEEGSPGDSVFILTSGSLKITLGGVLLETYEEPGTAFGETGFLQGHPRSATLTALKSCSFLIFPSNKLWSFIHQFPNAGVKILTQLALGSGKKLKLSARRFVDRVKKTPLSRFHEDTSTLNIPIQGTLFCFDLKKSELLLRQTKSGLDASEVLTRAIFPFRIMMSAYDGIEVSHQGDSVSIFFPIESTSPKKIMEEIIPKFFQTKADLEKLFKQDRIPPPDWEMNYRLSIGFGSLTPSFECLKNLETPIWKECENRLFTESARLFEIEKTELNSEKDQTLILLSSLFLEKLGNQKIGKGFNIESKHGVSWSFSVIEEEFFNSFLSAA